MSVDQARMLSDYILMRIEHTDREGGADRFARLPRDISAALRTFAKLRKVR